MKIWLLALAPIVLILGLVFGTAVIDQGFQLFNNPTFQFADLAGLLIAFCGIFIYALALSLAIYLARTAIRSIHFHL